MHDEHMPPIEVRRSFWWGVLVAIIVTGILSRITHTGIRVFDKYLGDALYAAMVYVLLRLTGRISRVAVWAAIVMTAIELFQLTGIPAAMFRSGYAVVRACARLLGTEFHVWDLVAYATGIGCIAVVDRLRSTGERCGRSATRERCRDSEDELQRPQL
jgi:hypothetical protein